MSTVPQWTIADIPKLTGRRAVVTGATGGIGRQVVSQLALAGADVILLSRDAEKLDRAVHEVIWEVPRAKVDGVVCDLADIDSVRDAAKQTAAFGPISILVNNAAVMGTPHRRTRQGLELQLATNHFGHFALTGLLLESLVDSGNARVVSVSSHMARGARRPPLWDPTVPSGRYRRWIVYSQTKLANLLFSFELDRRATRARLPVTSVAAHPGYTRTGLQKEVAIVDAASGLIGQSAELGALPVLMAATAPGLPGSSYVGPSGPFELRGTPKLVRAPRQAHDPAAAQALWSLSEQATGVRYLSP